MSGYFISFEGIDGAGKSTQIKKLATYLVSQGYHEVVTTQEPGGTCGAKIVRDVFLYSDKLSQTIQYLLMIGARADHIDELIAPALKQGKIVLSDRYFDSSAVYQEKVTQESYPALFGIGQKIANSCRPDLTIILDIDPSLALARIEQRKNKLQDSIERNITLEIIAKRRAKYLDLAKIDKERCYVVNAMQESTQLSATIASLVIRKLQENHAR
ncbi:MAG: dTMP kinase [Alphaproteobacteria bacterium]|nr:dTMP kinase [Alphaproteobacteria bacterium]